MRRPRLLLALPLVALALVAPIAGAQEATPPPFPVAPEAPPVGASPLPVAAPPGGAGAPDVDTLARAKELFRQGNELRKAGDCEGALERFAASRALVPSVPNILNSAFCLNALGRADEALDDYALLLSDYTNQLQPDESRELAQAMAALRDKVGGLQVVANVAGAILVVDGKPRGTLPRLTPVRILPGEHRVLVLKDGYRAIDTTAHVDAAKVAEVRANLAPLAISGRVRIDAAALVGADIVVDGAPIAQVPWEGALAAGTHWFALRRGDLGTAPTRVVVVDGQTAVVSAALLPLGPDLDVVTSPPEARLTVGDIDVGAGRFRARLPMGALRLSARAEGYLPRSLTATVNAGGPRTLEVRLAIDPDHPRWKVNAPPFHWLLELHGAPAIGPGFASDAQKSCKTAATCSARGPLLGGQVELRGGLRLPDGLSFELALGYLGAGQSIRRTVDTQFAATAVRYAYHDRLAFFGPLAALGIGFVLPVGIVEPRAHLFAGAIYAGSRDRVSVTATAGGTRADAVVEKAGQVNHDVDIFVRPELGVGLRAGHFRFGLDVGAAIFVLTAPKSDQGSTLVQGSARCASAPGSVYCAPYQNEVASERAYHPFVVFTPALDVGYVF